MGPTLLNIKTETVHDKVQRKSQITPNWNKNCWHTNPVDHSFSLQTTDCSLCWKIFVRYCRCECVSASVSVNKQNPTKSCDRVRNVTCRDDEAAETGAERERENLTCNQSNESLWWRMFSVLSAPDTPLRADYKVLLWAEGWEEDDEMVLLLSETKLFCAHHISPHRGEWGLGGWGGDRTDSLTILCRPITSYS